MPGGHQLLMSRSNASIGGGVTAKNMDQGLGRNLNQHLRRQLALGVVSLRSITRRPIMSVTWPLGGGRLRQTQLSFLRATPSSDLRLDDTVEGEGAVPLNFSTITLNTTTVGQQTDYGQKSGLELADDV